MCVCVCVHTDLLRQVLQKVLSQSQVSQVGQVTDPSRQRGQLIIGQHKFLEIKSVSLKKKKKMYTMLCFKCLYIFEVHKFCALFCINVNFFVTNIVLINILKRKEEEAQARGLPVGLSGRRSRSGATPACSPPGRARAASASSRCREVTSSVGCWTI